MEQTIRRVLARGPVKDRDLKRHSNAYRLGMTIYENALKNLKYAKEIQWSRKLKMWEGLE